MEEDSSLHTPLILSLIIEDEELIYVETLLPIQYILYVLIGLLTIRILLYGGEKLKQCHEKVSYNLINTFSGMSLI